MNEALVNGALIGDEVNTIVAAHVLLDKIGRTLQVLSFDKTEYSAEQRKAFRALANSVLALVDESQVEAASTVPVDKDPQYSNLYSGGGDGVDEESFC